MKNGWREIQDDIWNCFACEGNPKVERNIRQQTESSLIAPQLLVVAVAPPYLPSIRHKVAAQSVTNNSDDGLRKFLEGALELPWEHLRSRGLIVLHAVKCAIIPNEHGFQNPSSSIVDTCAPRHLAMEFDILRPPIVLALGTAARRAVLKMPDWHNSQTIKLSGPPEGQHDLSYKGSSFKLIVTRFPRGTGRHQATIDLKKAAALAGILGARNT